MQNDNLNLDSSSSGSSRHNERSHSVQAKCTFCGDNNHSAGEKFKRIRKEKEKARADDDHLPVIRNVRIGNDLDVDLNIT